MVTASSPMVERVGRLRRRHIGDARRLIRQASAWLPMQQPQPARLQDLEEAEGIRWVEIYGGDLRDSEALALLDPICGGALKPRMARDLVSSARFPAGRRYDRGRIEITAAFRTRHLPHRRGGVTSIFEPVHLLVGEGWLLSCWLPSRVYRGLDDGIADPREESDELYDAVVRAWLAGGGETAAHLAESVREQLAIASGYRPEPG